jgi:hypothetical protein
MGLSTCAYIVGGYEQILEERLAWFWIQTCEML